MIWSSTRSWISSTDRARFMDRQLFSTLSAMRRICIGVMRASSATTLLALVTAAMILTRSKVASEPFRLMIFMGGSSLSISARVKKRAGTGFVASRCGAVITIPDIGAAVKHLGLYFVDIDDRKSRETQYIVFHGICVYEGSDRSPAVTGFRGSARGTGACAQPAGFR